jgi:ATP-dependent RNA helicase DDX49/DBP8
VAKTGEGKTLAFALPILQTLSVNPYGIFALVLTPTRKLANQIGDTFRSVVRLLEGKSFLKFFKKFLNPVFHRWV